MEPPPASSWTSLCKGIVNHQRFYGDYAYCPHCGTINPAHLTSNKPVPPPRPLWDQPCLGTNLNHEAIMKEYTHCGNCSAINPRHEQLPTQGIRYSSIAPETTRRETAADDPIFVSASQSEPLEGSSAPSTPNKGTRFGAMVYRGEPQRQKGFKPGQASHPNAASKPVGARSPSKATASADAHKMPVNVHIYVSEVTVTRATGALSSLVDGRMEPQTIDKLYSWSNVYVEADWRTRQPADQSFIDFIVADSGTITPTKIRSMLGYQTHFCCLKVTWEDDDPESIDIGRIGGTLERRGSLEEKLGCFNNTKGQKEAKDVCVVINVDQAVLKAERKRMKADEEERRRAQRAAAEALAKKAKAQAMADKRNASANKRDGIKAEKAEWTQAPYDTNNPPEFFDLTESPAKTRAVTKAAGRDTSLPTPSIEKPAKPLQQPERSERPHTPALRESSTSSLSDVDDRLNSSPLRQRKDHLSSAATTKPDAASGTSFSSKHQPVPAKKAKAKPKTKAQPQGLDKNAPQHSYETRNKDGGQGK